MIENLPAADLKLLMDIPQFRDFLFAAIQSAGVLSQSGPAIGSAGRDLSYIEGRRDFALELLKAVDRSQPAPLQTADGLNTLMALLHQATLPKPKEEKPNHDRFNELD